MQDIKNTQVQVCICAFVSCKLLYSCYSRSNVETTFQHTAKLVQLSSTIFFTFYFTKAFIVNSMVIFVILSMTD